MPQLVAVFLIVTLASIGLPGLNGFVGEFLILLGAFSSHPRLTAVAAVGVVLSATYMLWMFQRVNYGPVTNEKNARLVDLTREWATVLNRRHVCGDGTVANVFLRPMAPQSIVCSIASRRLRWGDYGRAMFPSFHAIVPMACRRVGLAAMAAEAFRAGRRCPSAPWGWSGWWVPACRRSCSGIARRRALAWWPPTISACS
jgi:NADH:ubiquinone oxidoreductase subunit 5 (subunit L)/multisubunit Na+/H+ antiporter MnhA subunit